MDEHTDLPEYPDLSNLADEAPRAAASPATADTLERIVSRARRGRAWTAVATVAVACLVGSGAGFIIARNTGPAETRVDTASLPSSPTTMPVVVSGANGSIREGGQSGGGSFGASFGSASATGSAVLGPLALTRAFVRTTADGVEIRGYLDAQTTKVSNAACAAYLGLTVEFSDNRVAGSSTSITFTSTPPNPVVIERAMTMGIIEGDPIWLVMAQTAPGVAKVVAHFPDGSSDQMSPVNGWAGLAHRANSTASPPSFDIAGGTLQAFAAGGQLLGTVSLAAPEMMPPNGCLSGISSLATTTTTSPRRLGDLMIPVTTTSVP